MDVVFVQIGLIGAVFGSLFCIVLMGSMWLYEHDWKRKAGGTSKVYKLQYANAVMMLIVGSFLLVAGLYVRSPYLFFYPVISTVRFVSLSTLTILLRPSSRLPSSESTTPLPTAPSAPFSTAPTTRGPSPSTPPPRKSQVLLPTS
jgi:hypothetical protein